MQYLKVDPLGPPISEDVKSEPLDTIPAEPVSVGFGPEFGPAGETETALLHALRAATAAHQWNVVTELARQLDGRRSGEGVRLKVVR